MEACNNCNIQMEGGYSLKSNTYGKISIMRTDSTKNEIKVFICPSCGKVTLYFEKNI